MPPAAFEPPPGGRGWGKKVLIGCGILALVVAACLLALILYLRQRPETVTDVVMKQVESHYAPDVTPQEKEDLRAAYAGFRVALKERRVPREPLDRMRTTIMMSGSQNEISRDQVRQLTELFRRYAPPRSELESAAPLPTPRPTP